MLRAVGTWSAHLVCFKKDGKERDSTRPLVIGMRALTYSAAFLIS